MSYSNDEAAYLRLANAWQTVHGAGDEPAWPRTLIGILTLVLLSPVIGMVLVFAVLPALPIALLVGIVLGPMNLFSNGEREEEEALWERQHGAHGPKEAHA